MPKYGFCAETPESVLPMEGVPGPGKVTLLDGRVDGIGSWRLQCSGNRNIGGATRSIRGRLLGRARWSKTPSARQNRYTVSLPASSVSSSIEVGCTPSSVHPPKDESSATVVRRLSVAPRLRPGDQLGLLAKAAHFGVEGSHGYSDDKVGCRGRGVASSQGAQGGPRGEPRTPWVAGRVRLPRSGGPSGASERVQRPSARTSKGMHWLAAVERQAVRID